MTKDTTANTRLSFRAWLKQHRKANTPIGDLARDTLADPCWPRGRGTLNTYRNHLYDHGAVTGAIEALEQAWEQYSAQNQR